MREFNGIGKTSCQDVSSQSIEESTKTNVNNNETFANKSHWSEKVENIENNLEHNGKIIHQGEGKENKGDKERRTKVIPWMI